MSEQKPMSIMDHLDAYQAMREILYQHHGVGGSLHIITDDGNLLDSDIDFCQKQVMYNQDPHWLKLIQVAMLDILSLYPEGSLQRESIDMGAEINDCFGE